MSKVFKLYTTLNSRHITVLNGFIRLKSTDVRSILREDIRNVDSSRDLNSAAIMNEINVMNFDDHVAAYRHKATAELARSLLILKLCSWDRLVDNSLKLMEYGQKIVGDTLFKAIIKPTFYKQFVAGEESSEIIKTTDMLLSRGINPLPTPMLEEDESSCYTSQQRYDKNLEIILDCIKLGRKLGQDNMSMIHFKATGLISAKLLSKLSLLFQSSSRKENLVESFANRMSAGTKVILDGFSDEENDAVNNALIRFSASGQCAHENNVKMLIDAEFSYTNPGIDLFALAMMVAYNQRSVHVYGTYQCYLKDTFDVVRQAVRIVDRLGSSFGAKIVRGAYINIEKERAIKHGYPDPVCKSIGHTAQQYDRVVDFLLRRIAEDSDRTNILIATHNEDGVRHAVKRMTELNINVKDGNTVFAQIMGIGDHISNTLANEGYIVYKSIPYGQLEELLPYLSRRAIENKALMHGAAKERIMIWKELKRRFIFKDE